MNKFTKSILALGLALSILVGVGGTSVFAGSRLNLTIDGHPAIAESRVSQKKAWASTSYEHGGRVNVQSSYTYLDTKTMKAYNSSASRTSIKSATVNFNAPEGCQSVGINSCHRIEALNKTWTVTTSSKY